jgi:NAD-dependent deacetylase
MTEKIAKLKNFYESSNNIVFFGGAGVSTESGIPDFRSTDGLYNAAYEYPPETILSHTFFTQHTKEFYRFYRDKMIHINAKPNAAHIALAEMERRGKLKAIITQNIDGLHQAAGSKNVIELHGSGHRNFCVECGKFFPLEFILQAEDIPVCTCGGIVKPHVVLYEEGLNEQDLINSVNHINNADMLIIAGTSLLVYPAAALVNYYEGERLVVINKSETHVDSYADLAINGSVGEVLAACIKAESFG